MPSRPFKDLGLSLGFDLVSVGSAAPLEEDGRRYRSWVGKGCAAGMAYMSRGSPRRWAPKDLLPEAASVATFGVNFFSGSRRLPEKKGFGRVARYAWGKDYHEIVRERLEEWVRGVSAIAGRAVRTKILVDSGPLLERGFAANAGAGFFGKNTLLISRKMGSYLFLSEVLTDLEIEPDPVPAASGRDHCGSCRECLAKCPTGALVSSRVLDAGLCISYLTIENRGAIPEDLRGKIGDWIFGCDVCQEVCPYNGLPKETLWKGFLPEQGAGPYIPLLEALGLRSEGEFREKFAGSPVLRARREGLVRNACVVAANQDFREALPLLRDLAGNDPSPLAREHALWAMNRMEGGPAPSAFPGPG